MKRYLSVKIYCLLIACLFGLGSCNKEKKRMAQAQSIVFNELMASNRTGLLTSDKEPADWIELKNTSADSIDLQGFFLEFEKFIPDTITETEDGKKIKRWEFPAVKIGGGEHLLIFADKVKEGETPTSLTANFKLAKEGGTLRLLTPKGNIVKELVYEAMEPDMALALGADSLYHATFMQSPGFENTHQGHEAAVEVMEAQRNDPLKIWEVMNRANNNSENWVELKNTGSEDVNLSEYKLSKKWGKKEGWTLPAKTLKPGELVVIRLAGRHANPFNNHHADFKIGNSETIILSRDGKFVDGVCAKSTVLGGSIGRKEGEKGFFHFSTPTHSEENHHPGKRHVKAAPEFNKKAGVFAKGEKVVLRLKDNSGTVHYTLNGEEPTSSSPVFKDSLVLDKTTTVRAYAESDSTSLRSRVATNTYIFGPEHKIPVMNITVNHGDLYNYSTGIYVEGPGYTAEWPHKGANYWQRWTKKAHVQLFDGNQGFSTDCGLKIFGGFSRAEAKKSFRLKFRSGYGNQSINYDFFGQGQPMELEDLVLRAGAQDYNRCMIRDEFFTSLMQEHSPTLLTQLYRPVALYINGQYFGLYYMREKIDNHFVGRKLNLSSDSISMVMSIYVESGKGREYKDLVNYTATHDMKDEANYKYIADRVDLQGLIDQKLGQIFSGNSDIGNVRYVQSRAKGSDGKWRFVFYDLDATWVGNKPEASYYLRPGSSLGEINMMVYRLLENKKFRQMFLERLSHHLTNTFSPENTTAVFDALVAQIDDEMKLNCQRWPTLSYETWQKNIASFRSKFADRPKIVLNDLRQYLKITDEENKKYFSHLGY